jgi:hypothetical protein
MSHSTHVGFRLPPSIDGPTARPSNPFTGTVPSATESPVSLWSLPVGVGQRLGVSLSPKSTASVSEMPGCAFEPSRLRLPLDFESPAVGVGQRRTQRSRLTDLFVSKRAYHVSGPSPSFATDPSGVGHNPDAVSEVRGTDGRRRNAVPDRVIPEGGQVTKDSPHPSSSQESWDVLHEDVAWS